MLSIAAFGIKYDEIFQYLSALMVICILYQETFDIVTRNIIVHTVCIVSYITPKHVYPLFIGPLMILVCQNGIPGELYYVILFLSPCRKRAIRCTICVDRIRQ